jgi:hypothetical protein
MTAAFGTEEFAANIALGLLGQPEIASMADATTRARKVRQFFPVARDHLQRDKQWNFCTAWVTPAADIRPSPGPLKVRYPLPQDCLRVRFIKGDNRREWAIESAIADVGGVPVETMVMVTNISAPNVCYSRRITAVRLWDAIFLPAFGHMLAGYLATSLGKSQEWGEAMKSRALAMESDAATIDAKERGPARRRPETSFEMARRGCRRPWR